MKILYHHRTKSRDGQAVHIRELITAFRSRGHLVNECALSPVFGENAEGEMGGGRLKWGGWLTSAPSFFYELAEHAYGPLTARRLTGLGKKMGADFIYERHALNNTAGLRAARSLGVPLFLEVNSPLAVEQETYGSLTFQRWAERCEKRVLCGADHVLCVTRVLADMLIGVGVSPERISVIPNGVDLSLYPDPGGAGGERAVVGFTGFFRPWHQVEGLVDSLAEGILPLGTQLLLVGDGPSMPQIQSRVTDRKLDDSVEMTGAVSRSEIPPLLKKMDIAVQPAATPWASPLKLFEYMAAGLAVVAPDQENIREVIAHEENGLLFDPGDPEAMPSAVARLAEDRLLREELGKSGRATIESREFTWLANACRLEELASSTREGKR
ncbi:MAG: glycosyltransferase family 4 protein [Planctomycetota bacterium]|nr:glycosyltransferase family 4 protein [Planctomycetota bacterium]